MVGWFLLCAFLAAGAVVSITVIIDPLQFYHKVTWYTPRFSTEERYQNPGLAKNWDYDTIVIGTSMTENFLPSVVGKELGGTVMKLSMEGSTADEHNKMAKVALGTGKVKKILWGLDYFSLKSNSADESSKFPDYMYDDKLWNDYPYLFNYSVYEQFINDIKAKRKGMKQQNLEYLYNWNRMVTYGKAKVAKTYATANEGEVYFGLNEEPLEVVKKSFENNILSLVKAHPEVEFNFYYPPYSVLRQVVWYNTNPGRFENQIEMRKWMYEQFAQYPNVKLYDFQAAGEWTYDLDLYKDLSHHKQDVNTWIAEAIGRDDAAYRVTDANIDVLNDRIEKDAETAILNKDNDVVNVSVSLDGQSLVFTNRVLAEGDSGNELLVPVKQAAAALGAELSWDQPTKTVSLRKDGHEVRMIVDAMVATVDGSKVDMAYAPKLVGGTALVPVSFVFKQMGWNVDVAQPDAKTTVIAIASSSASAK
ncbi:copper amine oxidase N-terminal domain-containing protein [Cohnella sp. AR92]|uniref:copper amine oxidase N-terminal domain-containing protein n=1 Tax=Cohnella sp. AR92 TaxID=648716 RepID=UPI0013153832|nr:copper amine oxidase N-terminal domain-containing protein [Cohnella sp. AR92]